MKRFAIRFPVVQCEYRMVNFRDDHLIVSSGIMITVILDPHHTIPRAGLHAVHPLYHTTPSVQFSTMLLSAYTLLLFVLATFVVAAPTASKPKSGEPTPVPERTLLIDAANDLDHGTWTRSQPNLDLRFLLQGTVLGIQVSGSESWINTLHQLTAAQRRTLDGKWERNFYGRGNEIERITIFNEGEQLWVEKIRIISRPQTVLPWQIPVRLSPPKSKPKQDKT
ncbi:hypothetical protein F5887DRAFT_600149 [Amanita rubescens]|nr:hypothetical protein F5887DRAFT_600149 [Amanita rubescens]